MTAATLNSAPHPVSGDRIAQIVSSVRCIAAVDIDRLAPNDLSRLGQQEHDDAPDLDRLNVPTKLSGRHTGEERVATLARLGRKAVGDLPEHWGRHASR